MRRTVFAVLALAFILPLAVQAQQWDAEQQEVWDAVVACSNMSEADAIIACFHDDFVGWGVGKGVPDNKADRAATLRWFHQTEDNVWLHMKPVSIDVRGDMAIVLYVYSYADRSEVTGEVTTGTTNWTDILVRDGGRWLWLADHGTEIEPN